jgi:hypothetical protein
VDIFDIYIAYVSWQGGGKSRPVLVMGQTDNSIIAFNITTQYENKSEEIRKKYFKIEDWEQAGLHKQSYVDTKDKITLLISSVDVENPVGVLTENDMEKLVKFLSGE